MNNSPSLSFSRSANVMSLIVVLVFILVLKLKVAEAGADHEDMCRVKKCKSHGPDVRYPFWLKDKQPPHCGYPDPSFELTCNEKKQTVLHLPSSVEVLVNDIDYIEQWIHLSDPQGCINRQLSRFNLSASPFRSSQGKLVNYTLFNCSQGSQSLKDDYPIYDGNTCYSFINGVQIQAIASSYSLQYYHLVNCTKIVDISQIPENLQNENNFYLDWYKPMCSDCEAKGNNCGRKNNTVYETECIPKYHRLRLKGSSTKNKEIIAGVSVASFLLVLIVIGLHHVYNLDKIKKEIDLKIEKFLEDYRSLTPSRYSYVDIKRITNQFKEKLGEGGFGTVFKGRLSNDVLVAVKLLNDITGDGNEFINEVGSMTRIHHVNIARLVGFCSDGNKRALVYEYLQNESLEKYIFVAKGENKHFLGWNKLQVIALGIAKGIEYLHQGCEQRILHLDIKPHNILLDHNFNPKISDFGLAKLCPKEKSAISLTAARGTMGYIAPEVVSRNFGNVSYKSDVYSFGMLLLEMVGGRKNIDERVDNTSQVYFPEWVYNHLDRGEEIGIRIEDESHAQIARKLTIVGLWCIQWYPADRPSMKAVIQMLEAEVESLIVPPNPFASTNHMKMGASASKYRKPIDTELEIIEE